MLSVLPETAGDLIVVQASNQLTAADYQSVLVPQVESKLKNHVNIRLVIYFDPSFTGMELGAIWEDAKLGIAHANDFYRLAVVGGPDWAEWAATLGNHLAKGEARHFSESHYLQAMHWVNEA